MIPLSKREWTGSEQQSCWGLRSTSPWERRGPTAKLEFVFQVLLGWMEKSIWSRQFFNLEHFPGPFCRRAQWAILFWANKHSKFAHWVREYQLKPSRCQSSIVLHQRWPKMYLNNKKWKYIHCGRRDGTRLLAVLEDSNHGLIQGEEKKGKDDWLRYLSHALLRDFAENVFFVHVFFELCVT